VIAEAYDGIILDARNQAVHPIEREGRARDEVRLLVSDAGGEHDRAFRDLPALLRRGDLIVVNDSATMPAALDATAERDGRVITIHLSTRLGAALWIVEPRGAAAETERFRLPFDGAVTLLAPLARTQPRLWLARFDAAMPVEELLVLAGRPIAYAYVRERFPLADYQTVFARIPGSAEMPSAARPFTPRVLAALRERGVDVAAITLHCGVASGDLGEPPPLERFAVPHATVATIERAQRSGGSVIAIGTTVVRALESAREDDGALRASAGLTELVVDRNRTPLVDGLLTGFHEPRASHIAMLEAFLAPERLGEAYRHAMRAGYRWHEFGDVHLIRRGSRPASRG
jgi:S-adenosylmethionine:tRNA ribosyltransferase-isomerase